MGSSKFLAFYCKKIGIRGLARAIPQGNTYFMSKKPGGAPKAAKNAPWRRCSRIKRRASAAPSPPWIACDNINNGTNAAYLAAGTPGKKSSPAMEG
nr:hypothetical protein [uncultured Janthinobacterium sp.]